MTISLVREAPAARKIAVSVLTERLSKDFEPRETPGVLAVLPLYGIPNSHFLSGGFHRSWRWGWRYFWVHPDLAEGAIIDIRRTAGGRTRLQRYATGRWVQRVTRAMSNVSGKHAASDELYRPRILRLPEIHMEAFWLSPAEHQGQHYFESLIDEIPDDDFVAEARTRLQDLKHTMNGDANELHSTG